MSRPVRGLVIALALAFAALAGWRIFGMLRAEGLAGSDPERALQWSAGEPDALWALAERRLAEGDRAGAARSARALLTREPLQGRAFRMLARIAAEEGRNDEALALYQIAARRAPRDRRAVLGLTQQLLDRGDTAQALRWIDFYLRTSGDDSRAKGQVLAWLTAMAQDGRFADALADRLRQDPPWRGQMVNLLARNPAAGNRVLGELSDGGALKPEEFDAWINGLITVGDWEEADSRWRARFGAAAGLVHNGDFTRDPRGVGFDWRFPGGADFSTDFESVAGTGGRALVLRFYDQRARGSLLEHALKLTPGDHALRLRLRARALRAEVGLVWQIFCSGNSNPLATGAPISGSLDWTSREMAFSVPAEGCSGQWLRLSSPVAGAGQPISGVLWVKDVQVESVGKAPGAVVESSLTSTASSG